MIATTAIGRDERVMGEGGDLRHTLYLHCARLAVNKLFAGLTIFIVLVMCTS